MTATIAAPNERRKALLAAFLRDVWSGGDIERCGAYLAPIYTIHHDPGDPWDGQKLDLAAFVNRVRLSRAPFPDQKFHVRDMIADESRVVVTWLWTATHGGDQSGSPATRRPIKTSGITVYYFERDDLITGHWQIVDRLEIYKQLQHARQV